MRDVRLGLFIAVPAAVALMSIIWFLRNKSKKKERGSGSGARRDPTKVNKTLKDHDKPEEQVPAHLSHRENQGITLTQRKIPEVPASEQRNFSRLDTGPTKSTTCGESDKNSACVVEETNCEESLTSSQALRVQQMVQSAIGDGILEASHHLSASGEDGIVGDGGNYRETTSKPEVTENFVQECMMSATAAPVSCTPPTPRSSQHLCNSGGDNNQNDNCSQNNSLIPLVPLTLSTLDTKFESVKNENNAGQLAELSSLTSVSDSSSSSSSLFSQHHTESLLSHSHHHGEEDVSSCGDHQLSNVKSNQNIIFADQKCDSEKAEYCSGQTSSQVISSQNSSFEKTDKSDSRSSLNVESCSTRTDETNTSVRDNAPSDSTMDTSKKSVRDTIYSSASEDSGSQQLDEPSASSVSPMCDNNSVGSNDSGRGGSEQDGANQANENLIHFDFNMPSDLCGRLIGRQGKNINLIKSKSGANVTLTNNPFTPEFQICQVIGSQAEVDEALAMIRRKFPLPNHPGLTMAPLNVPIPSQIESPQPVIVPEGVQLSLPEGVSVDVYVSAIVNAGHVFVQQPTHRTFMSLEKLNFFLNSLYGQDATIPKVPEPVECGVICVCENEGSWYRTMITSPVEENGMCQVKFVDYGGYAQLPVSSLKQIRTDFMSLPFQAVECFMANVSPMSGENYFSDLSTLSLSERTQLKLLKCQVVARSEDGTPFIHLYDVDPDANTAIMLNRTLVDDNLVRWVEIL